MTGLMQDLRYAFRQLLHTPSVTLAVIGTLAVGIAGNATVFNVVSSLLLRPLPFAEPGRVVSVFTSDFSSGPYGTSSYLDYRDFEQRFTSFERIAALDAWSAALATPDQAAPITLGLVSTNFFATLGLPVALGRDFVPAEDSIGAAPSVILSQTLWRSRFGADSGVLGRTAVIGGQPFVVIGVTPPGFAGPNRGQVFHAWAPLAVAPVLQPGFTGFSGRDNRSLALFARLRKGVSLTDAQREAASIAAKQFQAYPDRWRTLAGEGRPITLLNESASRVPPGAQDMALGISALLLVVTGLVLVIVCANLANLLLARGVARRHEMAIRVSLGASRNRLLRQTLVETGLLSLAGGLLGFGLTRWAADAITGHSLPVGMPFQLEVQPDWRVALFTALVALFAGLALGLLPALRASRVSPASSLQRAATGAPRVSRLQAGLVVSQVGLSLVLLVGAGLFVRSLARAAAIDPGFGLRRGLLVDLDVTLTGPYDEARYRVFLDRLLAEARALPGVRAAVLTSRAPLSPGRSRRWVTIAGYAAQPGEEMEFRYTYVSAGYFETLGIPLLRGRGIHSVDETGPEGGLVVNEAFARRFWAGADPLTQRISVSGPEGPFLPVVGVARDTKYSSLSEAVAPAFFIPFMRRPAPAGTLILSTEGDPATLAGPVQNLVRSLDPMLPVLRLATLDEHVGRTLSAPRIASWFIGGFGVLGLVLAAIGLTGLLSYGVAQRTREIGIRLALGARPDRVVRMVVGRGLLLMVIGLGLGLGLAIPLAGFLRGQLYGLSPLDPITYLAVTVLFIVVAVLASWLPAWRAARIDPSTALRTE